MLTLHHLNQSRSFRIVWLLEELKAVYGVDYHLHTHQRGKNHLAPDELIAIHPMGKAPILVDDELPDGQQAIAESAVVIAYLLDKYDHQSYFLPQGDMSIKAVRDYQFWLHFAEGSLMPVLVMGLILNKTVEKSPFFIRPITKQIKVKIDNLILSGNTQKSLNLLDSALAESHWLCDDKLTGADIQMYFAAKGAARAVAMDTYPNIKNWLKRCESRAAFIKAVEVGGKPL